MVIKLWPQLPAHLGHLQLDFAISHEAQHLLQLLTIRGHQHMGGTLLGLTLCMLLGHLLYCVLVAAKVLDVADVACWLED